MMQGTSAASPKMPSFDDNAPTTYRPRYRGFIYASERCRYIISSIPSELYLFHFNSFDIARCSMMVRCYRRFTAEGFSSGARHELKTAGDSITRPGISAYFASLAAECHFAYLSAALPLAAASRMLTTAIFIIFARPANAA